MSANKGKHLSPATEFTSEGMRGANNSFYGRHHSEESIRKMSLAHMGKPSSLRGMHVLHSGSFQKGHMPYITRPNLGKHPSEETLKKMRGHTPTNKGKHMVHSGSFKKGHPISDEFKKMRAEQIIPYRDTKPERIVQQSLRDLGIDFTTHKPILGQPDIFIEPNICIFIDGDYWHSRPESINRDDYVNRKLREQGYVVHRIWEHEVLTGSIACNVPGKAK